MIEWATGIIPWSTLRGPRPTIIAAQLRLISPAVEMAQADPVPAIPVADTAPARPAKKRKKPLPAATLPDPPTPPVLPLPSAEIPISTVVPLAVEPLPAPPSASPDFAGMEVPGTSLEPGTAVEIASSPVVSAQATHAPRVTDDDSPPTQLAGGEERTDSTANTAPPKVGTEGAATAYQVAPPPSAELKYAVEALRGGQAIHGNGKINWQAEGKQFKVTGEAGVLFFSLLNFSSEGRLDQFGVSPVLYSEKRFRKSETNTHFHRERNTISFSASTAVYPRSGGEQDRASIIWQLAAIGRGDSTRFYPGARIDIMVAGVRDAEIWQLRVIGLEDIALGSSNASAWHVIRTPRPGSYEQTIDIWLAPQQEWYPVKLRFTETSGDYLDMSLTGLHPGVRPLVVPTSN